METISPNQRRDKRSQLLFNLAIYDENQNNIGEIVNISTHGALVKCSEMQNVAPDLSPGDPYPIQAWVLFSNGEFCKIKLDTNVRWVKTFDNQQSTPIFGVDFSESSSSLDVAENIICELAIC